MNVCFSPAIPKIRSKNGNARIRAVIGAQRGWVPLPASSGVLNSTMATTYYFLSAPSKVDVLDWFRQQPETGEEHVNDDRTLIFYRQFSALAQNPDGSADPTMSPLVSVFLPKVRRGVLWTVGEVHFLHMTKAGFPRLDRIRKSFQRWLEEYAIVWDRKQDNLEDYGYYFEGTIKNIADKIYALPDGLSAIEAGQFFAAEGDNELVLDRVCKSLRLRGVNCI